MADMVMHILSNQASLVRIPRHQLSLGGDTHKKLCAVTILNVC